MYKSNESIFLQKKKKFKLALKLLCNTSKARFLARIFY